MQSNIYLHYKSVIALILFLFLNQCIPKNSDHSQFWDDYFSIQNELRNKYKKTGELDILYGKLISKNESKLTSKDDSLFLGIGAKQIDRKLEFQFNETISQGDFFHTISIYKKSEYNKRKTYRVTRKTKLSNAPVFTVKNIIDYIITFNNHIRLASGDTIYKNSKLYNFICENFDCSASNEGDSYTFNFKLDKKLNTYDPQYYRRLEKLFEHIQFKSKIYYDLKQGNQIEINNYNKSVQFKINKIEKIPNRIIIKSDIVFNYYGLKLEIKNLTYNMNILIKQNKVFFDGSFEKLPEKKITGRLLYIFPPDLVDVFIPGNIEEYLHDSLYLMTKGGANHKGNIFTLEARIIKNKMDVDFYSESEIFSEPLMFSSSSNNEVPKISSNNFMRELEKKIVEEMSGK